MKTTTSRKSVLNFPVISFIVTTYYSMVRKKEAYERSIWEFGSEKELAEEMSSALTIPDSNSPMFDIPAEEFEKTYLWFLS